MSGSRNLSDESGTVESSLVLILIVILFLGIAQLEGSSYIRAIFSNYNQGSIANEALSRPQADINHTENLMQDSNILIENLPGGGRLLISKLHKKSKFNSQFSGALDSALNEIRMTSIVVDEN